MSEGELRLGWEESWLGEGDGKVCEAARVAEGSSVGEGGG